MRGEERARGCSRTARSRTARGAELPALCPAAHLWRHGLEGVHAVLVVHEGHLRPVHALGLVLGLLQLEQVLRELRGEGKGVGAGGAACREGGGSFLTTEPGGWGWGWGVSAVPLRPVTG
jgi:hypothetical protein